MENAHHTLNYIELPATDLPAMKAFYGAAFGWTFIDYGPTYASFQGAGLDGGFDAHSDHKPVGGNGALVILISDNLEQSEDAVKAAGGVISRAIFAFPGGRRFHFIDPSGNELAVWAHVPE